MYPYASYKISWVGLGIHVIHDDVRDLRAYLATKNASGSDYMTSYISQIELFDKIKSSEV